MYSIADYRILLAVNAWWKFSGRYTGKRGEGKWCREQRQEAGKKLVG